jgi:NAD(P) transhydrogenase subunit alpha
VTEEAVRAMRPGSVIVDLAAETGGNCALTVPGEIVERHGVTIVGTTNLPATMPYDASRLYARNIFTLLQHLMKDGALVFDDTDEITRDTTLTRDGEITHKPTLAALAETPA